MTAAELSKVSRIVDAVCKAFGVTVADLEGRRGCFRHVTARHATWTLIRARTSLTQTEIGLIFSKCHSAISNGVEAFKDILGVDRETRERFGQAQSSLYTPEKGAK